MSNGAPKTIRLTDPFLSGGLPLVEAIAARRSVRAFSPDSLQLFQVSQILWAAQGITDEKTKARAVPSAGATYPLEIDLVVGEDGLENVEAGVCRYDVENHGLILRFGGDVRPELADAAFSQDFIAVAPVCLVISAVHDRTMERYNARGERYVFMEAGHAAQNIYLQATALNLCTVAIGAFREEGIRKSLQLDGKTRPLYILPIGKTANS